MSFLFRKKSTFFAGTKLQFVGDRGSCVWRVSTGPWTQLRSRWD